MAIDFADLCCRTPVNKTAKVVTSHKSHQDSSLIEQLDEHMAQIQAKLKDKQLSKRDRLMLQGQKLSIIRHKKLLGAVQ